MTAFIGRAQRLWQNCHLRNLLRRTIIFIFSSIAATVMADVAVLFPSTVLTVIVVVPAETAETNPDAFTVATAVLLEVQVTF